MRELKFRAWDDVEKRMYYGNTEQFDDMLGFRFQHFETDKPVYMQYTGLKDRNGRKIYEGDVLRLVLVDYAHVPEQIFVVSSDSFFEDVCYLQNISRFVEDSDSETDGIEVIGNIYESPELPKGEESE